MQVPTQLLDQVLSGASGQDSTAGAQPSGGLDLSSLINGPGGLATGAAAGGLVGLLLGGKKSRKFAASALKVGGVALAGGLAYKAWRDWQANKANENTSPQAAPQAPSAAAFIPTAAAEQESLGRTIARAMIAAAKADGHVTDVERAKITAQLGGLELPPAERAFVESELAKPLDIEAVARSAQSPEQAAEIYAASLLVVDTEGQAERAYLSLLAARLQLDPELVAHLHAQADAIGETADGEADARA